MKSQEQKAANSAYMKAWRVANPDKAKARSREWYKNNREKSLTWSKAYRLDNPEKMLAYSRKHFAANPEKRREACRKWRARHPDSKSAESKAWFAAHPENRKAYEHARRARKHGNGGTYTPEDIQRLLEVQHNRCAGCAKGFCKSRPYTVDHVAPISRGGSNNPENLQLLCKSCNSSKNALSPDEWAKSIGKLFV